MLVVGVSFIRRKLEEANGSVQHLEAKGDKMRKEFMIKHALGTSKTSKANASIERSNNQSFTGLNCAKYFPEGLMGAVSHSNFVIPTEQIFFSTAPET